jgi:aryl-alcohol dehydrogenase-like predicted oxidoreductase
MRLSTDENRNEERAIETIAAAAQAGITVFDTAHAYGQSAAELGHNERLLARALRQCGAAGKARIVTKGGMNRSDDRWIPDGRAKAILADCEASLLALDGLAIDLYLIHAPDPNTPWATSLRALARILDESLVKRVGVANVNRRQLNEAQNIVNLTAVQVALNPFDDSAVRGGVVPLCEQRGISVIAHSPLGGPRRATRLTRLQALADVAGANGATPAETALAWVLDLSPVVVAIPGARHPESARSAARAANLHPSTNDRAVLNRAFGVRRPDHRMPAKPLVGAEVVMLVGIPGAGKSRLADDYVNRGYLRLNRDEAGGSLTELASTLDAKLAAGAHRVVMDNTYLTRAARSHVIETANRHRVPTRCIWLDTPLAQAQVNLIDRLLDRFGSLPSAEDLRLAARREPGFLMPTSQMRAQRELEVPSIDEGLAQVDRLPFSRAATSLRTQMGVFVAAGAMTGPDWKSAIEQGNPRAPHLVFDWCPKGCSDALAVAAGLLSAVVTGPVESSACQHGDGPPTCWCRPPLPGLFLAFARVHSIDPSRSLVLGITPAHRRLAMTLGAEYVPV